MIRTVIPVVPALATVDLSNTPAEAHLSILSTSLVEPTLSTAPAYTHTHNFFTPKYIHNHSTEVNMSAISCILILYLYTED